MMTTILVLGGFVAVSVVVMVATAAFAFAPQFKHSAAPPAGAEDASILSHHLA